MKTRITEEQNCSTSPHAAFKDCLFLSLAVILSMVFYIQGLGFYSDDWVFLGTSSMSQDQSLAGLVRSNYSPWVAMRPVQILYIVSQYWLFGLYPLGYHLVNGAVLLSGILLFYLVLCKLGQRRVLTLAIPLVYALLPHYSTDRFWVAASQSGLSMAFFFLSLYSDLRSLEARGAGQWAWKLVSILSILASVLAYEVFLPLFFCNLVLVWYRKRQLLGSVPKRDLKQAKLIVLLGVNLLALIAVIVFKLWTTVRMGTQSGLIEHIVWFLKGAIIVKYGDYGLGLPRVMLGILRDYPDWTMFATGGMLGLIIFGYTYIAARESKVEMPSQIIMFSFIICGLVVFGMCTVFLAITRNAGNSPTGIANRVFIAAAVGIALSMVGAIGVVSRLLPSGRLCRILFCMLVALLCVGGFQINNTLASFWIAAYHKEKKVLADLQRQFPCLHESTLILDGVCPYVGPAVVFESNWDLRWALIVKYRDYSILADVVTPHLTIKEDGLSTMLYGFIYSHYPYDEKLFIYHIGRKMVYPLPDARAANAYFQTFNPDRRGGCPPGEASEGVPVF